MPRVSEEYYEKKRREIIDAAFRVCTRKPVSSVEMKDIIAEAGYSHGAIYRYYKNVDEILHDLVVTVNSENRIDEKLNKILKKADMKHWKKTIYQICDMLAGQMKDVGIDLLKLSIYSDMLAMSDPERAAHIAEKLGKEEQSPLIYLVVFMSDFLERVIKENALKPSHSIDEIIQFIIVGYHGISNGYVLSECFKAEQVSGKYKPELMFSCLADSVIAMLKGVK
ncbi:MAG: TetR/AcrR family transcriptional regulator [Lachnospiraceae bacterium]|nr:TetR/AcrR family transcriptional regulator [Lachnospiraceae bacterium]